MAHGISTPSLNCNARDGSPVPPITAAAPMTTISSSPISSISVKSALIVTGFGDAIVIDAGDKQDKHDRHGIVGRSTNAAK